MEENSFAKMEMEMFFDDIRKFVSKSVAYSKRNVQAEPKIISSGDIKNIGVPGCDGFLGVDIFAEVPKDILVSLCDVIQRFAQICETQSPVRSYSHKETDFISGVKCVNNIVKHKRKDFDICDLVYPNVVAEMDPEALDAAINGRSGISSDQVEVRLGAVWVAIKQEIKDGMRNQKHFEPYRQNLEGEDVADTVYEMLRIVNQFFCPA